MYKIKLKDHDNYLKREGCRLVITDKEREAYEFSTEVKAVNVINNLSSDFRAKGEWEYFKSQDISEVINNQLNITDVKLKQNLDSVINGIRFLSEYKEELLNKLSDYDKLSVDYTHKIEFDTKYLNAAERNNLVTAFAKALEERREVKNEIELISKILSSKGEKIATEDFDSQIISVTTKKYTPRIKKSLFKDVHIIK